MSSEKESGEVSRASDGSSQVGVSDEQHSLLITKKSGRQFRLRPGEGSAAIEWLHGLPKDEQPEMIPSQMEIYVLPKEPGSTVGVSPVAIATEARLLRIAKQFALVDRVVVLAVVNRAAG